MISKHLLRLGWNWNCQCCQHGIFFVNVWYLLDNPAACITSHITGRKMNECHSLEVFSVQTTEVKVLIFWLIPALMLIFGYLWKSALKPDTTSDSKENHVYQHFQFQCHCDSHLCNSGVQTFSFKVAFVTRGLFRFIKVTFALYSSSSYLRISYT